MLIPDLSSLARPWSFTKSSFGVGVAVGSRQKALASDAGCDECAGDLGLAPLQNWP